MEMLDLNHSYDEEKEFWDNLGENEGYLSIKCPKCGRIRVEHWSCGKDICEKCYWCMQDKKYYTYEMGC